MSEGSFMQFHRNWSQIEQNPATGPLPAQLLGVRTPGNDPNAVAWAQKHYWFQLNLKSSNNIQLDPIYTSYRSRLPNLALQNLKSSKKNCHVDHHG